MAATGNSRDKRRLSGKKTPIVCLHIPEEPTTSNTTYTLQVDENSTILHYHGQNVPVDVKNFDIIRYFGEGFSGTVSAVGIFGHPDIRMAVKSIMLETKEERQATTYTDLRTIQAVGSENHPFIVAYYGAVKDMRHGQLLICMELMDAPMDKFYQIMHSLQNVTFDELDHVLRRLINNITSALHFLKIRRILHRDVKPPNMLVNRQAIFKLCDFGICGYMRASESVVTGAVQGTANYLPPEVVTGRVNRFSIRVDMWGLGISLLEIVNGTHPFKHVQSEIILNTTIDAWTPSFSSQFTISSDMEQIILNLLKSDPEQRPKTYPEILEVATIRNKSETSSSEEIAFVTRVIDNILPSTPS